jgi:hypothetical protein
LWNEHQLGNEEEKREDSMSEKGLVFSPFLSLAVSTWVMLA